MALLSSSELMTDAQCVDRCVVMYWIGIFAIQLELDTRY